MTIDKTAIRNAATVIVIRDRMTTPSILMGQRGAKAAFMPNKFHPDRAVRRAHWRRCGFCARPCHPRGRRA